jgi:hypothetical protein
LKSLNQLPQIVAAYLRHLLANRFYDSNYPLNVSCPLLLALFVPVKRLPSAIVDSAYSR